VLALPDIPKECTVFTSDPATQLPLIQYTTVLYITALNPLRPELNSICYLLALLAHHFLHVSRIRVKSLTFRRLMSYIYGTPILDVSRSHTSLVQRSPTDCAASLCVI